MAEKYIVEGYEFDSKKEADEAKKELEAVSYLAKKTQESTPEAALKIYNKITEQNMFHTPVGLDFVAALGDYLIENGILQVEIPKEPAVEEEVKDNESQDNSTDELPNLIKPAVSDEVEVEVDYEKKYKTLHDKFITSVIFNVILAIGIVVMIWIASTSSNVNIINYETALQDKYSSWAEELKDKEADLKAREKALEEK